MNRRLSFSIGVLTGLLAVGLSHAGIAASGGGVIEGTVKVTGVASSADAVIYLQQAPGTFAPPTVGSSRVDLQACKLEYSIVSPK